MVTLGRNQQLLLSFLLLTCFNVLFLLSFVQQKWMKQQKVYIFQTWNNWNNIYMNGYETDFTPKRKLFTMFTSFKISPSRYRIHNNTVKNWAQFSDVANLILYTDKEDVNASLGVEGWDVRPVPSIYKRYPVLRDMYIDAIKNYDSTFYIFSNSDILYTKDLVSTLLTLEKHLTTYHGLFACGRRVTFMYRFVDRILKEENTTSPHREVFHKVMAQYRKPRVYLDSMYALDYFVTTKTGFPWKRLPSIVIGNVGVDNFIATVSLRWNLTTIDLSDTVTAVHQKYGLERPKLKYMNGLFLKYFHWKTGGTKCMKQRTYMANDTGEVILKYREKDEFVKKCTPRSRYRKRPKRKARIGRKRKNSVAKTM